MHVVLVWGHRYLECWHKGVLVDTKVGRWSCWSGLSTASDSLIHCIYRGCHSQLSTSCQRLGYGRVDRCDGVGDQKCDGVGDGTVMLLQQVTVDVLRDLLCQYGVLRQLVDECNYLLQTNIRHNDDKDRPHSSHGQATFLMLYSKADVDLYSASS